MSLLSEGVPANLEFFNRDVKRFPPDEVSWVPIRRKLLEMLEDQRQIARDYEEYCKTTPCNDPIVKDGMLEDNLHSVIKQIEDLI